ncbi:toprim domain-containing protein [Alkalimonas sp. MEB108]|uniref:Toprim domain-containing protein n=1 Tax=Alkalimonas cellulosilytica TaxID=3058395 RepID=A0ABU7J0J2_9GAMM|nr:toprim domain-containing protein [Alkalimonas sp. MEB108]MEE2000023.1 toprim domain-containing protein [Alkalimonas sp. MEB108]
MSDHKKRPAASGRRGEYISRSSVQHSPYQFIPADSICHAFSQVFGQVDHDFACDGNLHRLDDPTGKTGNKACWYVSEHDSGVFGSWREGVIYRYKMIKVDRKTESDPQQQAKHRALWQQKKLLREQERIMLQAKAQIKAQHLWTQATPAIQHPYLLRKQLPALNLRQASNALVVPLFYRDKLCNVQFITADGQKRFLKHGRVQGAFCPLGTEDATERLLICEGWATGATLHMQYDLPIACAMFAGNLVHVARELRARYPKRPIVICADDDRQSQRNVGLASAKHAAQVIAASWAKPTWPDDAPTNLTDFNDLYLWMLQQGGCHECY